MALTKSRLASTIDHTVLKPMEGHAAIDKLCAEAREHGFFAVCVNPVWVARCRDLLKGSPVKLAVVAGFPLGANRSDVKAFEAARAVDDGADEVDMVLNVGALCDGDTALVEKDIKAVVQASAGRLVKVIFETCFLSDDQIVTACKLSVNAGAGFVKTSTGFGSGGATTAHVALMRQAVGLNVGVKASGGVKTLEAALAMIEAGASRIGTSSGVALVRAL
jgi:deoxyribose-phosphate aldolase